VFAQEVLVEEWGGDRRDGCIEVYGFHCHLCDDLEGQRIFHGFGSGWSPGKRAMSMHEYRADLQGIDALESLNDHIAGLPLIGPADFLGAHGPCHRHGAVEIVGMGGSQTGYIPAGLGKSDGIAGVGVDDRANAAKGLKKPAMSRGVGGVAELPLDHAILGDFTDDHVLGPHRLVVDAAGFDGKNSLCRVSHADVAKSEIDQPVGGQQEICLETLFFDVAKRAHD